MNIDVLTIFPDLLKSPLEETIIKRAIKKGKVNIGLHDIRNYSEDKHNRVDDYPYGGGPGMVMKPGPIVRCAEDVDKNHYKILLTPKGKKLNQSIVDGLAKKQNLMIICGRYEGVDKRVEEMVVDEKISIGDYILSGGEIPSLVLIDAIVRLLPGVLGNNDSTKNESFIDGTLEYPQYTRPRSFRNKNVPEVLLSGNHEKIREWREEQSQKATLNKRPDLIKNNINVALVHYPVYNKEGDVVSSSITPIDLHDISRTCKTYNVNKFYVVSPLPKQNSIVQEMLDYWENGYGEKYNKNRKEALSLIRIVENLEGLVKRIENLEGKTPEIWATSAKFEEGYICMEEARKNIEEEPENPVLILFGTGWGLTEKVLNRADVKLEPIKIKSSNYNHLSVRSAAAIILDRLLENRRY